MVLRVRVNVLNELFVSFLNKLWKLDTLIIMIITQIGVEHKHD